ncbi:acyltransferase domain-containing protein [Paenibacillus sp. SAF-054]|uniref:acyltransferase domain-containing protein n=1 Tax=unclassified Paenibacillus TaxID=185978 RepID=UPI003F7D80D5
MDLNTFCERIQLSPGARRQLSLVEMDEGAYARYKQLFVNDRFRFFDSVKQAAEYRRLFLYFFVRFAADAYEGYRIRGIEDEVYDATFSDIELWSSKCKEDYGEYGIEEYNWLQEHVQLRLFRLGRLQFQPYPFDRDLVADERRIYQNQIVLNVHIPSGEPLYPEQVEDSFERARCFFRGITPIFMCHSWLLFPKLAEVLPPDSNIVLFQKHFRIYHEDPDAREAEQRIFNRLEADITKYEECSSLQRSAKAYLMAGNKLGSGYGIK